MADTTCNGRRWLAPQPGTSPAPGWLLTGYSWPAQAPPCPGCTDCEPQAQLPRLAGDWHDRAAQLVGPRRADVATWAHDAQVRLLAQALEAAWQQGRATADREVARLTSLLPAGWPLCGGCGRPHDRADAVAGAPCVACDPEPTMEYP